MFRDWSVGRIASIIAYLSDGADFSDFDIFKAKNITDAPIWDGFSPHQKDLIEQISYAIYVASKNKQDNSTIACDSLDIKNSLKSFVYDSITAFCGICNEPFFPRCVCGSSSLSITKKGQLLCMDCGQGADVVFCEEGHNQRNISAFEVLVLYPTENLLRKITESLKSHFEIDLVGSFYIHSGQLTLLHEQKGALIRPVMIPELKPVSDMNLSSNEYDTKLKAVQDIKEKCVSLLIKNATHVCYQKNLCV